MSIGVDVSNIKDLIAEWQSRLIGAANKGYWSYILEEPFSFDVKEQRRIDQIIQYFLYLGFHISSVRKAKDENDDAPYRFWFRWGDGESFDLNWMIPDEAEDFMDWLVQRTLDSRESFIISGLDKALNDHSSDTKIIDVSFTRGPHWFNAIERIVISWCDMRGCLYHGLRKNFAADTFIIQFEPNYRKK